MFYSVTACALNIEDRSEIMFWMILSMDYGYVKYDLSLDKRCLRIGT